MNQPEKPSPLGFLAAIAATIWLGWITQLAWMFTPWLGFPLTPAIVYQLIVTCNLGIRLTKANKQYEWDVLNQKDDPKREDVPDE